MKKSQLALAMCGLGLTACQLLNPVQSTVGLLTDLGKCRAVDRSRDSIIGGETVAFGDPDQNLVMMITTRHIDHESVCTGALISDRIILTAAHCVAGQEPGDIVAEFMTSEGCATEARRFKRAEIETIVIHKAFDGTPQSIADLALLRLKEAAPPDHARLHIIDRNESPSSDRVLLLGYGITDETKRDSQVLRRVYKSLKEDLKYRSKSIIVDQSREAKGFCRGDSGAPLLVEVWNEPRILGINSANVGMKTNEECHTLSLAMDVKYFSEWITSNRENLESPNFWEKLFPSKVRRH